MHGFVREAINPHEFSFLSWHFFRGSHVECVPCVAPSSCTNLDRSGSVDHTPAFILKDIAAIPPFTPSSLLAPLLPPARVFVCVRENEWAGRKKARGAYLTHKPVGVGHDSLIKTLKLSVLSITFLTLQYFIHIPAIASPPPAHRSPVPCTSAFLFLSFSVYLSLPSLYGSWSRQRNSTRRWGLLIRAWLRGGGMCLSL